MALEALIVDDDEAFSLVVEIRLKGWRDGLVITKASSISAARDILSGRTRPFDIVILDQNLPDGLGIDITDHPVMRESTVLAVSADESPDVPGRAVRAGAQHFLGKRQVTTPLFIPLVEALLDRRALEKRLRAVELKEKKMEAIKVLLATLKHEINNPLGAVLGAAYLLRQEQDGATNRDETVRLIETSGKRIKHVIEQLCDAVELEAISKADELVYQVPGDAPWPQSKKGESKN